MFDVEKIRGDFPLLHLKPGGKDLLYFDSAATTQKPLQVISAITDFYQNNYGTVHRAIYTLAATSTKRYSEVREKVAQFLDAASSDEIVFTKGTTEAINLVATCFGKEFLEKGDEILISQTEHHSNIVPWQNICKEKGAILTVAPVNSKGELILDEFEKLLNHKTKLVSIAHISNVTGTIHPIKKIIAMAHKVGAKVFIDAAQSASHIPFSVQGLDVDFLAFSGHKIYGPTGIGILYGKKELLKALPPYQFGGDMILGVSFTDTTYQEPPLKFEAGTPPIGEVIGLGAALDYISQVGKQNIADWEHGLTKYATQRLLEIEGLRLIGTAEHKSAIISFLIDGVHPLDLGTMLDTKAVAIRTGHLCAQPTMQFFGTTSLNRISFGLYNTLEEIDEFIRRLKEVLSFLRA
ncbi:MAG: SufS family cysteine desulfurase [Chlamydiae bacterium]|nr:SufS family cysteine desulfurase [Chlamydiota bacterium]